MENKKSFIVKDIDKNKRLDIFVLEQLPDLTRSFIKNFL